MLKNHGISSVRDDTNMTNIKEACTSIKGAGVLTELSRYYGHNIVTGHYTMAELTGEDIMCTGYRKWHK